MVEEGWRPLWVMDFPMFEWDPDGKRWPQCTIRHLAVDDDAEALKRDPASAGARLHMVLNGSRSAALGAHPSQRNAVDRVRAVASGPRRRRRSSASCSRRSGTALAARGIAFGLDRL